MDYKKHAFSFIGESSLLRSDALNNNDDARVVLFFHIIQFQHISSQFCFAFLSHKVA
jgi:hypothetical protein